MSEDWIRVIHESTRKHEAWRAQCINLVASENVASPAVLRALSTDLAGRYGDYAGRDLRARKYLGNRHICEMEETVNELARRLFRARHVELRALSGHVAGVSILLALARPGDTILELGPHSGGHRVAAKLLQGCHLPLQVEFLEFDAEEYNLDVEGIARQVRSLRPRLVILGSSLFLFPHPVAAIAEILRDQPDTTLAYDGSHVLGLIAGGEFQSPLEEGADVVFGSTHKTFFGPQGGLIYSDDEELMAQISEAVYPGLVTNHHLARVAALGMAMAELERWGEAYGQATIGNAKQLAAELVECGIPVVGAASGYTESHTVLIQTQGLGKARKLALRLEEAGIIVTDVKLPHELGSEGLRLGAQEITRQGLRCEDMGDIAAFFERVLLRGEAPPLIYEAVRGFTQGRCAKPAFCFEEGCA